MYILQHLNQSKKIECTKLVKFSKKLKICTYINTIHLYLNVLM